MWIDHMTETPRPSIPANNAVVLVNFLLCVKIAVTQYCCQSISISTITEHVCSNNAALKYRNNKLHIDLFDANDGRNWFSGQ